MKNMKELDIIIPVYRGLDETRECILSLVPAMPVWAHLIVINDSSPEQALTEWLQEESPKLGFSLYENSKNKGFVGTVNFGMQLNPDRDVLLLNSDVEVANSDWLERMRQAAYSHDRVASLTPFSNNATICSFPHFCEDNDLYAGMNVDQLDALFSGLPQSDVLIEVPTGVGFCMYIRRDCLDNVGYFDEKTFGKGYGEENDWCQRAIKLGWKNYHQLNVFAFHKGGVSFQEEGDPRKARALELLNSLHPNYAGDVHQFVNNDPARKTRLMAKMFHISQLNVPVILAVSHHLGGGVAQHVCELASYYHDQAWFIRLYPNGREGVVNLSLSCLNADKKDYFEFDIKFEYELLLSILKYLNVSRVHFHHTMALPPRVWMLPSSLHVQYDVTIHDYYMVNGNPTLTDKYGRFVGDDTIDFDLKCSEAYPIPVSPADWRIGAMPLLSRAERIIYPCRDVYQRFIKLFDYSPELLDKTVIAYHPDAQNYPVTNITHQPNEPLRVLILGALSREKGADLLEQVALLCDPTEIEFHLLGYAYRPLRGVITHGAYQQDNLNEKLKLINAHVVWYPALWPETYSYTLSIALERAYPTVCPNLGAFIERTWQRNGSYLLPWNMSALDFAAFWRAYSQEADVISFECNQPEICEHPPLTECFYQENYLCSSLHRIVESENLIDFCKLVDQSEDANDLCNLIEQPTISSGSYGSSKKERILRQLWNVRNHPVIGRASKFIPFAVQRAIKRYLSRKPMHEIINK